MGGRSDCHRLRRAGGLSPCGARFRVPRSHSCECLVQEIGNGVEMSLDTARKSACATSAGVRALERCAVRGDSAERRDQPVDVLARVVQGQRRPRGARFRVPRSHSCECLVQEIGNGVEMSLDTARKSACATSAGVRALQSCAVRGDSAERRDQPVDVLARVVQGQRRPHGAFHSEAP
jgi:uncharacterized ParB-like nuclease family protein